MISSCFYYSMVLMENNNIWGFRSSHSEVFLSTGVLKIYSKFTGKHPCRSVISIKLLFNFSDIALRHGCSPVNLLYTFRTSFLKNTSGRLFLGYRFYLKSYMLQLTAFNSVATCVRPLNVSTITELTTSYSNPQYLGLV